MSVPGLPAEGSAWPPAEEKTRYDRMSTCSVWYAGSPAGLATYYSQHRGTTSVESGAGVVQRIVSTFRKWFWAQTDAEVAEEDSISKLHVPIAQDIAQLSAELIASEAPRIKVLADPEEIYDAETGEKVFDEDTGEPKTALPKWATDTQERLEFLLAKTGWESLLLAALETSSALGAFGLRIAWDKSIVKDRPFLTRVDADAMIPEYQWGQLTAVTFWRVIQQDRNGAKIVRHLERHEPGRILHAVYVGGPTDIGERAMLSEFQATSTLATQVRPFPDGEFGVVTVEGYNTATSVPNMLPDPSDRPNQVGRSDFTPGVISLFDAIDRVYSSLMRDIELGQARALVANYMLEDNGPGMGASFNLDRAIFAGLEMVPDETGGNAPITLMQFDIRVQEHLQAIDHLVEKVIKTAGYSPQTMGDGNDGAAMTATESLSRDRRSLSTRDKKIKYVQSRLEDLLEAFLAVDQAYFNPSTRALPVQVIFPDAVQPDLQALAQTANLMNAAQAASLRVKVQTLHPDWDETQVDEEVERIQAEVKAATPAPLADPFAQPALPPGEDDPNADQQDTGVDAGGVSRGTDGPPVPTGPIPPRQQGTPGV